MSEKNKVKKAKISQTKAKIPERKCSKCGSIISSKILKQCPICDAILEELPAKISLEKEGQESLLVFTGKKLEMANKYVIKKDQWTFKEAIAIFFNSIVFYIFAELVIVGLFYISLDPTSESLQLPITIEIIAISQIPGAFLIIYPIFYIYSKKHKMSKLGLTTEKKSLTIALTIGIIGGIMAYFVALLSIPINDFLVSIGLEFFGPPSYLSEEYEIIRASHFIYKIFIPILLMLDVIGKEITFRGVLHNGLSERFGNQFIDRIYVILIVSSIYSSFFLFLTFNLSYIVESFLTNLVFGIIYEATNRNLYSTLCASSIYTLIAFCLILF